MTQPIGYWCPECGDLATTTNPFPWTPGTAWKHAVDCSGPFIFIPVYEPLAVPEATTWGESGGDEAVCLDDGIHQMGRGRGKGRNERWALQRNHDPERWFVANGRRDFDADAVLAINHVARATTVSRWSKE